MYVRMYDVDIYIYVYIYIYMKEMRKYYRCVYIMRKSPQGCLGAVRNLVLIVQAPTLIILVRFRV